MSIKDIIGSYSIDNEGGKIAYRGLSYQSHWAIKKLLQLHATDKDYVMLFEVFDDISVLDSEESPQGIQIFQVKGSTSQQPLTLSSLCKKNKKGDSILTKLISVKRDLPKDLSDIVEQLYIVSNSSFKCGSPGKYHSAEDPVCLTDYFSQEEINQKTQRLIEQLKCYKDDLVKYLKIISLIKDSLSYTEPERQTRDLLQEFFKSYFDGEKESMNPGPFYGQLITEIENRSKANKGHDYESTLLTKSITRNWFENILKQIDIGAGRKLELLTADLHDEGWKSHEIFLLEKTWRQMEINSLSDEEYFHGKINLVIFGIITSEDIESSASYTLLTNKALDELKEKHRVLCDELKERCEVSCHDKTDYYLKSLILCQIQKQQIKNLENS